MSGETPTWSSYADVLRGMATPLVWLKIGVTFLVPFIVSNVGLLIGLKRDP